MTPIFACSGMLVTSACGQAPVDPGQTHSIDSNQTIDDPNHATAPIAASKPNALQDALLAPPIAQRLPDELPTCTDAQMADATPKGCYYPKPDATGLLTSYDEQPRPCCPPGASSRQNG